VLGKRSSSIVWRDALLMAASPVRGFLLSQEKGIITLLHKKGILNDLGLNVVNTLRGIGIYTVKWLRGFFLWHRYVGDRAVLVLSRVDEF